MWIWLVAFHAACGLVYQRVPDLKPFQIALIINHLQWESEHSMNNSSHSDHRLFTNESRGNSC